MRTSFLQQAREVVLAFGVIAVVIPALLYLGPSGCGLMESDTGINLTLENLGGPYAVDIYYTVTSSDVVLNAVPDLMFTLATDFQVAPNPGFTKLLDGTSKGYADYYITGYSIAYTVVTANNVTADTDVSSRLETTSGGLYLHIQNGETFTSGTTVGSLIQVIRTTAQEDLVDLAGTVAGGLEIDAIANLTLTGHTEDNRSFSLKGSFDVKFREYAPES